MALGELHIEWILRARHEPRHRHVARGCAPARAPASVIAILREPGR